MGAYINKPCRNCGAPKERNSNGRLNARYCNACNRARWVKYDLEHRYCDSKSDEHNRWSCLDCQRVKKSRQFEAAARGAATRKKNNPTWFRPYAAEKFWQSRAHAAVQAAIKHGLLPRLKGADYACVDCGKIAQEYDHRDYGRPLDVQPVCRSCNKKRGTATWPSAEQYNFVRIGQSDDTPLPEGRQWQAKAMRPDIFGPSAKRPSEKVA